MGNEKLDTQRTVNDLLQVYYDLEKTLTDLRHLAEKKAYLSSTLQLIDVRRLITQLSASKRRIKRKISNRVFVEKASLERRLGTFLRSNIRDLH